MTCCAKKREFFFFFGGRGLVVCSRGELGWGRRRRNKGGEGRQSDHKLTFADRIRPSMILSAILTINRPRHCTEIPV